MMSQTEEILVNPCVIIHRHQGYCLELSLDMVTGDGESTSGGSCNVPANIYEGGD